MLRRALLLTILCVAAAPAAANAAEGSGVQHLKFRYGPIEVTPGQNTIDLRPNNQMRPPGPGYITSFKPELKYVKGGIPRVDVLHLHHGVWLVDFYPTWAAGEEKTKVRLPEGYGFRYDPSQKWLLNYMIHNLTPTAAKVYLEWEMDFIPDDSPRAQGMKSVRTQWLDVEGIKAYPVFDVKRGMGSNGTYTYPTQARNPYPDGNRRNEWTVDKDATLVWTAGHLHPGGLHTDLLIRRDGVTKPLFRSEAKYFEPAGPVSWDVAMTNTPKDWRVQVRKGDVLSVTGTYENKRSSWYESMAIMPVAITTEDQGGVDPFEGTVKTTGPVNHGELPENDFKGGDVIVLPDARTMLNGATPKGPVTISGFVYGRGDLALNGRAGRPPSVRAGQSLEFFNADDSKTIWHTVTACRAPCNKRTGVAYPLANGPVEFDSGQIGTDPNRRFFTAASQKTSWKTPKNLRRGTYTYFCRVHPFMRGAFRVR